MAFDPESDLPVYDPAAATVTVTLTKRKRSNGSVSSGNLVADSTYFIHIKLNCQLGSFDRRLKKALISLGESNNSYHGPICLYLSNADGGIIGNPLCEVLYDSGREVNVTPFLSPVFKGNHYFALIRDGSGTVRLNGSSDVSLEFTPANSLESKRYSLRNPALYSSTIGDTDVLVDLFSGRLSFSHHLLDLSSMRHSLPIDLNFLTRMSYEKAAAENSSSALKKGFVFSFDWRLESEDSGYSVYDGAGLRYIFVLGESIGTFPTFYVDQGGSASILLSTQDGMTFVASDGTEVVFDSSGRSIKFRSRRGLAIEEFALTRDSSGRVTQIQDTGSLSLTISYTSTLITLTRGGRSWTIGLSSGLAQYAEDPEGNRTTFTLCPLPFPIPVWLGRELQTIAYGAESLEIAYNDDHRVLSVQRKDPDVVSTTTVIYGDGFTETSTAPFDSTDVVRERFFFENSQEAAVAGTYLNNTLKSYEADFHEGPISASGSRNDPVLAQSSQSGTNLISLNVAGYDLSKIYLVCLVSCQSSDEFNFEQTLSVEVMGSGSTVLESWEAPIFLSGERLYAIPLFLKAISGATSTRIEISPSATNTQIQWARLHLLTNRETALCGISGQTTSQPIVDGLYECRDALITNYSSTPINIEGREFSASVSISRFGHGEFFFHDGCTQCIGGTNLMFGGPGGITGAGLIKTGVLREAFRYQSDIDWAGQYDGNLVWVDSMTVSSAVYLPAEIKFTITEKGRTIASNESDPPDWITLKTQTLNSYGEIIGTTALGTLEATYSNVQNGFPKEASSTYQTLMMRQSSQTFTQGEEAIASTTSYCGNNLAITSIAYDASLRVSTVSNPGENQLLSFTYGQNGETYTVQQGACIEGETISCGRRQSVRSGSAYERLYTYTQYHSRTITVGGNDAEYSSFGKITDSQYPGATFVDKTVNSGTTQLIYDAFGRLVKKRRNSTATLSLSYNDSNGKLAQIRNGSTTTTYLYDYAGNLFGMSASADDIGSCACRVSEGYYAGDFGKGRQTIEDWGEMVNGNWVTHEKETLISGSEIDPTAVLSVEVGTFAYLKTQRTLSNVTFTFAHNITKHHDFGRISETILAEHQSTADNDVGFTHDMAFKQNSQGQLTPCVGQEVFRQNPADPGTTILYGHDAAGRINQITNNVNGDTATYSYDSNNGTLVGETHVGGTSYSYEYDVRGNITKIVVGNSEKILSYSADNFLLSFGGEVCNYDVSGYPTVYRNKTASWEAGRLVSLGGVPIYYEGELLKRVGDSNTPGSSRIIYQYNQRYDEEFVLSNGGTKVFHYCFGVDGNPIGFILDSVRYVYQRDLMGNVIAILGPDGIATVYRYSAYGRASVLKYSGSNLVVDSDSNSVGNLNPFRYRGMRYARLLGLYVTPSRYYDPETGRFISPNEDSCLGATGKFGTNAYCFSSNGSTQIDGNFKQPVGCETIISTFKGFTERNVSGFVSDATPFVIRSKTQHFFGAERRFSAGFEPGEWYYSSRWIRIGLTSYSTKTSGQKGVLYAFRGTTIDISNQLGHNKYAGIGMDLFGIYSIETYVQTLGAGISAKWRAFSVAVDVNLFGMSSVTFGITIDLGNGLSHTRAFTIGANTGALIFIIVALYGLLNGQPVPMPEPSYA